MFSLLTLRSQLKVYLKRTSNKDKTFKCLLVTFFACKVCTHFSLRSIPPALILISGQEREFSNHSKQPKSGLGVAPLYPWYYQREIVYFTIAHINDSEGHHIWIQLFVLTARSAILLKTDGSWKLRIMFSIKNTLRFESERLSKECHCNKICIYEDISVDFLFWKLTTRQSVNRFWETFTDPEVLKAWVKFRVLSFCSENGSTNLWNVGRCHFWCWLWESSGLSTIKDGENHENHFGELHFWICVLFRRLFGPQLVVIKIWFFLL